MGIERNTPLRGEDYGRMDTTLRNGDGENFYVVEEDIRTGLGIWTRWWAAQPRECPTQDFFTRSEIRDIIADKLEKSISHRIALFHARTVEDKRNEALIVAYDAVI